MRLLPRLFAIAGLGACALTTASSQTLDKSNNALLKGAYRFRHVAVQDVDNNGNPRQMTASYGIITFDGAGAYTVNGTMVDNTVSAGAPKTLTATGTYAIGSNGTGYIANPLFPTDSYDYILGAVSQGVFTGSATESGSEGSFILNDIFVAIPAAATPTAASFAAPFQIGVLDFTGASGNTVRNALFKVSPDGKGGFASLSIAGHAADQTGALTQTVAGATYSFATDGTGTLTAPLPTGVVAKNALFTGAKTMFLSADGNFLLGWTATGYDIFFGVKALTNAATNATAAGLYFSSALEITPNINGVDTYYGSDSNTGNSSGDAILHQRLSIPGFYSYDYGGDNAFNVNADGTTRSDYFGYAYAIGAAGNAWVAIGTGENYALKIGIHAATFSGPGVFLNPIGITNSASSAPITFSLAPGELITLYGSGLASTTTVTQGGTAFPTTLSGVSVTINGVPCPIFYVSPTQLSVVVPYKPDPNGVGLANVQVTNNGVTSNIVQTFLAASAPGVFSQKATGIGFAAALHAATGALVTSGNPSVAGEYLAFFLTGLGSVTPAVKDGAIGPTSPLSNVDQLASGGLGVSLNDYGVNGSVGNNAKIAFAGLAPTLAGLYQMNVQVPTTGLAAQDNVYVEILTNEADVNQIQVPYGGAPKPVAAITGTPGLDSRARSIQRRKVTPKLGARSARTNAFLN